MTPKKAIAAYSLTSIVFLLGIFSLYSNLKPQFDEVDKAIAEERTLVLNKDLKASLLSRKLYEAGYIQDSKDAGLISRRIVECLDTLGAFSNLGALMKPGMKVPAHIASKQGGENMKLRIENDHFKLGVSSLPMSISSNPILKDSIANATISVHVKNANREKWPVANIPVRLKKYSISSKFKKDGTGSDGIKETIVGYATTNNQGIATFKVAKGGYYSVVPIKKGFQYGREKGTTKNALNESLDFSFTQTPHVISLFSPQTFKNIKLDKTLIVRTPSDFRDALAGMCTAFILGWGLFLLFTFQLDKKLDTRTDYLLIITLMIITGIGLLASFGIWNPLTDTLYGSVMTNGLIIGLVSMAALMSVNYAKLDAKLTSSRFSFIRGYGWWALFGAMGLLSLLFIFGTGPEGSDAKVNLFGVQPSEICRILTVIFIAWFFARKGSLIQDFSQHITLRTSKRQLATISWIVAGILMLMGIYLVLSDMGPALVVLISFILLYSMARRDFAQLLLGLFTFTAMMLGVRWLNNSLPTLLMAAGLWFAAWIGYWFVKKRHIYESAIFLNLVLVIFALAGPVLEGYGLTGLADRLTNRTDMAWEGVWNNEVPGGDQIAQGIWSLATGGLSGLGLGNGSPSAVPAGHTDMIFTTIGEMLGFIGLVLVVLCFFVLIHRSLLIAKKAGYTFPFYLSTGLAIVTGVQFLIIVAGSIGLVPLTGITLPFLSYGRMSLIISLASFGFVLSVSRLRATEVQKTYTRSFNGSLAACSGLFLLISIVILSASAKYQLFSRGKTLIRPAFVTNVEDAPIIAYNPRISLVLRKLEAGNIYDRNGLLLATSNRDELMKAQDQLLKAGISKDIFAQESNQRKRRYYPFEEHTLFLLGDYNTLKVFSYNEADPVGYLAESRHLSELRGIEIPIKIPSGTKRADSVSYRPNRFAPPIATVFKAKEYDYSNLLKAGFLNYGIERNPIIDKHNASRQKRDLTLSIDARLQTMLQNAMTEAIQTDPALKDKPILRASVVVLNAKNGDLLCSANYPLPNQDSIYMLNDRKIYGAVPFEKLPGHPPITERDLGMTFQTQPGSTAKVMSAIAGFMQMGNKTADISYDVKGEETIEGMRNGAYIEPYGNLTMETAIVKSSNCYFINLVHDKDLYTHLDSLYSLTGVRVNPDPYIAGGNEVAYYFYPDEHNRKREFDNLVSELGNRAVGRYQQYLEGRKKGNYHKMNFGETQAAWGQGPILASPLNMARVASIVANSGKFTPTRYILKQGSKPTEIASAKDVISSSSAATLKSYMQKESDKHRSNGRYLPKGNGNERMGGKTGTPERLYRGNKLNDAWYIFFIDSDTQKAPLAVAVRLERTEKLNSGKAVKFVADVVIPTLNKAGYKLR